MSTQHASHSAAISYAYLQEVGASDYSAVVSLTFKGDFAVDDDSILEDILIDTADLDGDGNQETTIIRFMSNDDVVNVVVGAVDKQEDPLLLDGDRIDINVDVSDDGAFLSLKSVASNGSSLSSSISFVANQDSMGGSSSATAQSSTEIALIGQTESASSSSSAANATVPPEERDTFATADSDLSSLSKTRSVEVDLLIGTSANNLIIGSDTWEIMIGQEGSDTFVLSHNDPDESSIPDLVADFSQAEGDLFSLSGINDLEDVILEPLDTNGDGRLDSISILEKNTGSLFAIVMNTLDSLDIRNALTIEVTTETSFV